jgi:hypothetical protein
VRQLSSNFARGWPGTGLLLIRMVVGVSLMVNAITNLRSGHPLELTILNILTIANATLFITGLWTLIAGSSVVVLAVWSIITGNGSLCPTMLSSAIGASLALVGPGAWSLDSWLFGWKRIQLED